MFVILTTSVFAADFIEISPHVFEFYDSFPGSYLYRTYYFTTNTTITNKDFTNRQYFDKGNYYFGNSWVTTNMDVPFGTRTNKLLFGSNYSGRNSRFPVLWKPFSTLINLGNHTLISYDAVLEDTGAGAESKIGIIFVNSTSCIVNFETNDGSGMFQYANKTLCNGNLKWWCPMNGFIGEITSTLKTHRQNSSVCTQNPIYGNWADFKDISGMFIYSYFSAVSGTLNSNITLDNLNITLTTYASINISTPWNSTGNETGVNQLPTITDSNYIVPCLNNTLNITSTMRSFKATDLENDIIYYATSRANFNESLGVDFDTSFCIPFTSLCYSELDTILLNKYFFQRNNSCIVTSYPYTENTHNAVSGYDSETFDIDTWIELNGDCLNNDRSLYFNTFKNSDALQLRIPIHDLDINDTLNISLQKYDYSEFFSLRVERNNTQTYIYKITDNTKTKLLNFSAYTIKSPIILTLSNIDNKNVMVLKAEYTYNPTGVYPSPYLNNNIQNSSDFSKNDTFRIIKFSTDETKKVSLESLGIILYTNSFIWESTLSDLFFNEQGTYLYTTRVSDSYHKDLDIYTEFEEWYTITSCTSPYYNSNVLNDSSTNYGNFTQATGVIINDLSNSFNVIFNYTTGINLNFSNVFYWIYIIFSFILCGALATAILFMLGSPFIAFGIFGISFTLSQVFIYPIFLFGDGYIIVWSLLFVVSVASMIVSFFNNNN